MMSEAIMRLGGVAALLLAGGALAQAPAQAPTPQRTTASYEDWTVRCEARGTPPVKACEWSRR
jgi:invasion protein IalB